MLIVAANFVDRLVVLEDGRELPIAGFYASPPGAPPLNAESKLSDNLRVDDPDDAEIFVVTLPGVVGNATPVLIVEMSALQIAKRPN